MTALTVENAGSTAGQYEGTLQHITLLAEKRARLERKQHDAEAQLAHRASVDYASGLITLDELAEVYDAYRSVAGPGFSTRWNHHSSVGATTLSHQIMNRHIYEPNGPGGSWEGEYPGNTDRPAPRAGTSVVYVLFDTLNAPCYVGSTKQFRQRLRAHAHDGKDFRRWAAYPCRDRDHAYELEDRLLSERMPYLNRRAGR